MSVSFSQWESVEEVFPISICIFTVIIMIIVIIYDIFRSRVCALFSLLRLDISNFSVSHFDCHVMEMKLTYIMYANNNGCKTPFG